MTVKQMQKEIAQLTQRTCSSTDVAYLTQRLSALRRRKESGERMPNAGRGDPSVVVSVSLTKQRGALLDDACAKFDRGKSEIVREALDAWFAANGYRQQIEAIVELGDAS